MPQTAATSLTTSPLPPVNFPWFDPATGIPTLQFGKWIAAVDRILRGGELGTLVDAANDAAAAAAGVPVGGLYRLTNNVMIRLV